MASRLKPDTPKQRSDATITFRIPGELKSGLERYARAAGVSAGRAARMAIVLFLAQQSLKGGNK